MAAQRSRSRYRPRQVRLRDGREVTVREIEEGDAGEIVEAFERLSAESRYARFMQYRKQLEPDEVERGVRPRPGVDFVLVATIPVAHGIDIVGAAQYQRADARSCEFAVTVAEDWRRIGLATALVSRLLRRARRDGYESMQGDVLCSNASMLALARDLRFSAERIAGEVEVLRVRKELSPPRRGHATPGSGTFIAVPLSNHLGGTMKGEREKSTEHHTSKSSRAGGAQRDATTAPVSGGSMSGTGAPVRSRSHSGTTTAPGAGPNPNPIVTPDGKER